MGSVKHYILTILLWSIFGFMPQSMSWAQNVTPAGNGDDISADDAVMEEFTTLEGPVISETEAGQLLEGGAIILSIPDGFIWNVNETPDIDIGNAPGAGHQDTRLEVEFENISETEIEFTVTSSSITPSHQTTQPGQVTFGNIHVRPVDGILPVEGELRNTGTTAPGGDTNYGTLRITEGDPDQIRVETEPDGSGEVVPEIEMQAGDQLEVFAIVTDLPGNFLENAEADNWELINVEGELTGAELMPSADNRSAVFEPVNTGSARINAGYQELAEEPSGGITVESAEPNELRITQQPSATAEAGQPFDQQPVVEVRDAFDNVSTRAVSVEAQRGEGEGTLQGTTEQFSADGEVIFDDLSHTVTGDITVEFWFEEQISEVSETVEVLPGPPVAPDFVQQPSNTTVGEIISPTVGVGLVDEFGNFVPEEGVIVNLDLSEGSGSLNGNLSRTTDPDGVAEFDDLWVNLTGEKVMAASSSGLGETESEVFVIVDEGELAGFRIETPSGTPVADQTAGEPFDIKISARDGSGDPVDDFNDDVTLLSNAGLIGGEQTVSLNDGVADDISVSLDSARTDAVLIASYSENIDGKSNEFEVQPAGFDPEESLVYAAPEEIIANGISTSAVTVEIRDEFGNRHTSGGENVAIATTAGTLSGTVTDNEDGSYTEELTSSNTTQTAELSATVNGTPITSPEAEVEFVPGSLNQFRISLDGGGEIPDHTAGDTYMLEMEALDNYSNRVPSFESTVEVSSQAELGTGEGVTPEFTNGMLSSYEIQVIGTGELTINVSHSDGPESGSSNAFTVSAAAVDANQSTVNADPEVIESDGTSTSEITITAKDEFGNVRENEIDNVSAATTAGDLGGVQENGDGTYTATLTSSENNETAIVDADINGMALDENAEVTFTEFKRWLSAHQQGHEDDWSSDENWEPEGVPGENDAVIIPANPDEGDAFPIANDLNAGERFMFMEIEAGANLTVTNEQTLSIGGNLAGGGVLIMDEDTILNLSGNKTLQNLNAGTSDVIFNASAGTQLVENSAFIGRLELVDQGGSVDIDGSVLVEEELLAETGVELSDETVLVTGELSISEVFSAGAAEIQVSGDITNNGAADFSEADLELDGVADQQLANLGTLGDLTVSTEGLVNAQGDVEVSGMLSLNNGILNVGSGNSIVAPDQTYDGGELRMSRVIDSPQGWRTISTPLEATYGEFMDGTVSQGFVDADYSDRQPNILWYLEHEEGEEGLDSERWRAPADASETMQPGRGHLAYFFDDVPEDEDYNQPLPHTLQVTGMETAVQQEEFDFDVTYTAEADTGWNLIANPYASAINWDSSYWTKTNMDETIYVWDSSANGGEGDYLVWNGIDGSLEDGILAPFQAFWVKANPNPALSVDKQIKQTGGEFRRSREEKPPSVRITGKAGAGEATFVATFSEDGKYYGDRRDAYRLTPLSGNALHLYTVREDETHLVMKHLPERYPEPFELPLYVEKTRDGQGVRDTLQITDISLNNIPDSWSVQWYDTQNDKKTELTEGAELSMAFSARPEPVHFGRQAQPENAPLRMKGTPDQNRYELHIRVDPPNREDIPEKFALNQNYPNPFNSQTTIPFAVAGETEVRIELYDILGRKVKTLVDRSVEEGYHEYTFNASSLASGVYLYRMQAGSEEFVRKLTLTK